VVTTSVQLRALRTRTPPGSATVSRPSTVCSSARVIGKVSAFVSDPSVAPRRRSKPGRHRRGSGTRSRCGDRRDNSGVPVVDAGWISSGTHVSALGPKTVARHEVRAALAERAGGILTDSAAQLAAYPEPHLFAGQAVNDLGAMLAGVATARSSPEQVTIFCSVGLAGTEVAVAAALCGPVEPW
jgi:hypothetical protein